MKPRKNDIVKFFFKNGLQVEGKLQSWDKNEIIITNDDSRNYLVVTKPKEIIMYKVVRDVARPLEEPPTRSSSPFDYIEGEINDQANHSEEVKVESTVEQSQLNIKTLAELRKFQNEEERKALANKLKQHHIGEVRKVEYTSHDQIPGFYQK